MRRGTAGLLAVLLLGATGCGGSGKGTAAPTPSASTTAAPRDLAWRYAAPPSSWRRIGTQDAQGTTQWQVGTTRCGVSLSQPSGVGSAARPTSDDVADKAVSDLATTVPGTPTPTARRGELLLPDRVKGREGSTSVRFAARTASFGNGVQGYFLGYRDGDFALQLSAVCGQGAYAARAAELQRFVRGLSAVTTY